MRLEAVIAAALLYAAVGHAAETVRTVKADPRGEVEIVNVSGEVTVTGWDRSDVEATVSSQAVVAVGLLLYTPLVDSLRLPLIKGYHLSSVLRSHWANHDSGYWLALVALLLIAGPLFVSGDALRRLIDRIRPRR